MQTIAVARNAMATRFEIVLHGSHPVSLRAAGEEALDEIERLEAQLSLYRPTSEIARLNALASQEAVRVTPGLFRLLQQAQQLHRETGGAFDITIAPLVKCWGFMGGAGQMPEAGELAEARGRVGMELVQLNEAEFTVRFSREGVMLDLGAIGKGYALERAAGWLREAGIASALLNGGTSSIYALGRPPDAESWRVAVEGPPQARQDAQAPYSITVPLRDEAMSVSAVWGRSFEAEGKVFGHVLDPRNGLPVAGAVLSVVVLPSATETDALSTALLVAGETGHERIAGLREGMRSLVISDSRQGHGQGQGLQIHGRGITAEKANG